MTFVTAPVATVLWMEDESIFAPGSEAQTGLDHGNDQKKLK